MSNVSDPTPIAECPKCGATIFSNHPQPWCDCGEELSSNVMRQLPQLWSSDYYGKTTRRKQSSSSGLTSALRVVGVVDVISSGFLALYILTNSPSKLFPNPLEELQRQLAVGIAIAAVVQSVVVLIVMLALAEIHERVIAIHAALTTAPALGEKTEPPK